MKQAFGLRADFNGAPTWGVAPGWYESGLRPGWWNRLLVLGSQILLLLLGFSAVAQTNALEERIPPLKPARGEILPTFWDNYGLLVILGVLLALAWIAFGLWLLLRPKPPVVVPPAQQARQTLEPLVREPEDGRVLSRVSQEVRHYFVAAFGLPPGELTTAEFCRAIITRGEIGAPLSVPVTNFLRQCDERKFAPGASGAPLGAVPQALKFIEQAEARRNALVQAVLPGAPASLPAGAPPPQRRQDAGAPGGVPHNHSQ